jgi:hypothetical protein
VNFVQHGFLRASHGTITEFDYPGSTTTYYIAGINPAGTVAEAYTDTNGAAHGFLRTAHGAFTAFDPPGSVSTGATGINPSRIPRRQTEKVICR